VHSTIVLPLTLLSIGFVKSKVDPSLCILHHGSDKIFLLLYVNDNVLFFKIVLYTFCIKKEAELDKHRYNQGWPIKH
jgi:hypothetical protein